MSVIDYTNVHIHEIHAGFFWFCFKICSSFVNSYMGISFFFFLSENFQVQFSSSYSTSMITLPSLTLITKFNINLVLKYLWLYFIAISSGIHSWNQSTDVFYLTNWFLCSKSESEINKKKLTFTQSIYQTHEFPVIAWRMHFIKVLRIMPLLQIYSYLTLIYICWFCNTPLI